MSDDARLTDFVAEREADSDDAAGTDDPADGGSDGEDETDALDGEDVDGGSDGEGVDDPGRPAVTTGWAPRRAPCDDCGREVRRRWTDGDARVCADCKEW